MASYVLHYNIQITDINGNVSTVRIPSFTSDATTIAATATLMATWVTDLAALTNGKITRQSLTILYSEAQYLVGSTPPNSAQYDSVTDGAKLNFATGAGARTAVTVPAPLLHVFGANSTVVDSTQADVAQFITDFEAHAFAPTNVAYNLYKGGEKVGRGARKRQTNLIP